MCPCFNFLFMFFYWFIPIHFCLLKIWFPVEVTLLCRTIISRVLYFWANREYVWWSGGRSKSHIHPYEGCPLPLKVPDQIQCAIHPGTPDRVWTDNWRSLLKNRLFLFVYRGIDWGAWWDSNPRISESQSEVLTAWRQAPYKNTLCQYAFIW